MTKRITAALLAIVVCAGTAACGNSRGGGDNSKALNTDKANVTSSDEDSIADTESSADKADKDASSAAETTAPIPDDDGGMTKLTSLDPRNITVEVLNGEDAPSNEEMLPFAELAAELYSAAQQRDGGSFLKLTAADTLRGEYIKEAAQDDAADDARYAVLSQAAQMMMQCAEEKGAEVHSLLSGESEEEAADAFDELFAELDAEHIADSIYSSGDELTPLGALGGDASANVVIKDISRIGDDIYIIFDMTVHSGDRVYCFEDVHAWRVGGKYGEIVLAGGTEEDTYYVNTADVTDPPEEDDTESHQAMTAVKLAYYAVAEYCADTYSGGGDIDKKLHEDFPAGMTDEGLDISGGSPKAAGDRVIYDALHSKGYESGRVSLGAYDEEDGTVDAAYFTAENGDQIRYPFENTQMVTPHKDGNDNGQVR